MDISKLTKDVGLAVESSVRATSQFAMGPARAMTGTVGCAYIHEKGEFQVEVFEVLMQELENSIECAGYASNFGAFDSINTYFQSLVVSVLNKKIVEGTNPCITIGLAIHKTAAEGDKEGMLVMFNFLHTDDYIREGQSLWSTIGYICMPISGEMYVSNHDFIAMEMNGDFDDDDSGS